MLATGVKSVDSRGPINSFSANYCRTPSRIHDDNLTERRSLNDASERCIKVSTLGNRITTISRTRAKPGIVGNEIQRRPLSREFSSYSKQRHTSDNMMAVKPFLRTEEKTPQKLFIKAPARSVEPSEYESSAHGMSIRNILRVSKDKNITNSSRKQMKQIDEPSKQTRIENIGSKTQGKRPISVKTSEHAILPFHLPKNCVLKPDVNSPIKSKHGPENDKFRKEAHILTTGGTQVKRPTTSGQRQMLKMLGKVSVNQK